MRDRETDFSRHRLHSGEPLAQGATIALARDQANYLLNVLRLKTGDAVLVFNGRDGEWLCSVQAEGRKAASLVATRQVRPQTPPAGLIYLFAPLKHARLDYMAQKAVEMGAGVMQPVAKKSKDKASVPGRKLAYRSYEYSLADCEHVISGSEASLADYQMPESWKKNFMRQ